MGQDVDSCEALGTVAKNTYTSIFIMNICLPLKYKIPFPLVIAKLLGDYFNIWGYGPNKTFLLITHQFICAPNLRSVKRDGALTRKKSANFTIHAGNSVRIAIDAGGFGASM